MLQVTDFSQIHALIVEDMSAQQTALRGQLTLLGISKVDVASNADDACRHIRNRRYGLVLCDFNLNHRTDGQQLFEHLRDQQLLPEDCLFFMVTAESGYASVAAATEHHPDAYLLKPTTASDIEDRLKMLLEKRQALLPVTSRLARDDLPGALAACEPLLAARSRWTMSVMQIQGKTLLRLGRHEEARQVYQKALDAKADLVWAQLGLARAHKAAGQYPQACEVAQGIIQSRHGSKTVAAYDIVAETLELQGQSDAALNTLMDAAKVVPSARRQRILGESAYRHGDLDLAKECMQKVIKATRASVVAQSQDSLMLAQTLVDRGEALEAMKLLQDAAPSFKGDASFAAVSLAVQAQAESRSGQAEQARQTLEKAREALQECKANLGTVALAKAELTAGDEAAGLRLLEEAIAADHENPRIKQMIARALQDTGHADKVEQLIRGATAVMEAQVADARKLFRDSQIDAAIQAIEDAVHAHPDNTGVLLQAAQLNCMALRLQKRADTAMIERVQSYLGRLERLMPGADRVVMMQRYFRETLRALEATAPTA